MKIDKAEFEKNLKYRRDINKIDIGDIEIKGITLSERAIDNIRFIGFNTYCIVEMMLDGATFEDEEMDKTIGGW